MPTIDITAKSALEHLLTDGYVVVENLLDDDTTAELSERVQGLLDHERAHPFDPGPDAPPPDEEQLSWYARIWDLDDDERARLSQRLTLRQHEEFDTPWPVSNEDVCISFIHIPTHFDGGRSQRIFNLINKDTAFATLLEHPLVLSIVEDQLGVDAVLLDVSVNAVGPQSASGGWHVDSPLTQVPEPFPNFTLSMQTAWMLDDFRRENGATHVARGSHLSLRQPPRGRGQVEDEVVLEGPAGSLAIWLSQTWHRHGENTTDAMRRGVIVQYGRCWVKPFVDLRTPMTADQAAALSPRLRYMMGCNANAPVRGRDVGMTAAPPLEITRRSDTLFAAYVGFTFLAWYLNGLGAVLPPLRDEIGDWAGIYTLLPGAVLFAWGLITVTRPRTTAPSRREPGIALGFVVLTMAIVVMGITGWPVISVIGAVVAAIAAGHINRVLPGMLAAALRGGMVEPVMMRANAFSSVATIAAPLFVGASLALGAGWLLGFVVPIAIAALFVTWLARRSPVAELPIDEPGDRAPLPPFREWWRECAVLGVSIVVEFCFSYFAVTYLKEEIGMSKSAAAAGGAAWGVGMAIGRFLFSVRRPPRSIVPSAVVILAGFVLFWGLHSPVSAIIGIGVAGLGASPLYPSRITILIERFPGAMHEGSKRAALAAGSALLVAPALMVSLRALSDVRTAYLAVPVLLAVLVVLAGDRGVTRSLRNGDQRLA